QGVRKRKAARSRGTGHRRSQNTQLTETAAGGRRNIKKIGESLIALAGTFGAAVSSKECAAVAVSNVIASSARHVNHHTPLFGGRSNMMKSFMRTSEDRWYTR